MKEIVLNGITYIEKDSLKNKDFNIVILERGFVYIGYTHIEDDVLIIENAKNLRIWGTTRGLGQLVDGPTKNTVADDVPGKIKAPMRAVIHLISAKEEAWK